MYEVTNQRSENILVLFVAMFCPSLRVLSLVQLVPPPSPLFTSCSAALSALHAAALTGESAPSCCAALQSSCLLLNSLRIQYTTVSQEVVRVHSELYPRVQRRPPPAPALHSGLRRCGFFASSCYHLLIRKKEVNAPVELYLLKLGPPSMN